MRGFNRKNYYYDTSEQILFRYGRQRHVMSAFEHETYKRLLAIFGDEYYIFPQMHLSSLFLGQVSRSRFMAALRHINQKSVDYAICSREDTRPLVAIELDGWSHTLQKKRLRDTEVNRIAQEAGLPILHFTDIETLSPEELEARIRNAIAKGDTNQR